MGLGEYFAFDVVDNMRRILLSGGLVFISERGRAAGGTMIALFFYGLYENVKPYKRDETNVIASVANGVIAVVMLLLTILQGELMSKPVVGNLCIVISVVIFPVIAVFQLRSIKRRNAALAALGPKANGVELALQRRPSLTRRSTLRRRRQSHRRPRSTRPRTCYRGRDNRLRH